MRGAIAWSAAGSRLEKGRRSLILSLSPSAGLEPVTLIPSTSRPLTWPLAEAGVLSQCEPRKFQRQAPLPTRPTDASGSDNPAAGSSFFSAPPVTPPTQTPFLAHDRRPDPLRRPVICPSARRPSSCSTLGGETIAPPSRPHLCRFAYCRAETVPILPFPPRFLAGTAGWRHLLRPGGTALLCFPASRDPPGFRSPQKDWPPFALAVQRISFRFPQKKRSLAWGAGTTCFVVPREKAGQKSE
jgi:hypothetical protein